MIALNDLYEELISNALATTHILELTQFGVIYWSLSRRRSGKMCHVTLNAISDRHAPLSRSKSLTGNQFCEKVASEQLSETSECQSKHFYVMR